MPEGHLIHRLAESLTDAFAGHPVRVTSPQGRFAASAALIDGSVLTGAEAWGKHLFITFDAGQLPDVPAGAGQAASEGVGAPCILHVHLGLIGRFQVAEPHPVVGQVRVRIADSDTRAGTGHVADLRGPQTCRLLTVEEKAQVIDALGADPLRADADPEVAWRRIHASSRSIASLLMDQRVTAGVGDIYRCEVLFRHHLNPLLEGRNLRRDVWNELWADLRVLMAAGFETGRIDTVRPEHMPEAMGRPPRVDRHGGEVYVYRRAGDPCLVCGRPVSMTTLDGRNLYWCTHCQPRRRGRAS
ncbi:MAG: zinc finger domain-containing protein [Propionicimonas sp.]|nr:zinc finger domain-containing protein [Propionicimonas sp.]